MSFYTYSLNTGAMAAGVATLALPANSYNIQNSKILSITKLTGVANATAYLRSLVNDLNTNVVTLTINSSSAADTGTAKVVWTTPVN
jgi:hypothetical protein